MLSINRFLKKVFCPIFLSLSLFLVAQPSLALTVRDIPNPRELNGSWVADTADLLTADTEAKLNKIISALEQKNSSEIAVVTVPETSPSPTPKDFTTELFNYWHIGKYGNNNGILFLISKGDRRVEIETGYGLTEILPDAKVGKIIQQKIVPEFKQSHFDEGTIAGTQALITSLQEYRQPNSLAKPLEIIVVAMVLILAGLGLLMMVSPLLFPKSKSNVTVDDESRTYGVSSNFSDNSGSGSSDGFGGGSSGGDGGGGSFGGGDCGGGDGGGW